MHTRHLFETAAGHIRPEEYSSTHPRIRRDEQRRQEFGLRVATIIDEFAEVDAAMSSEGRDLVAMQSGVEFTVEQKDPVVTRKKHVVARMVAVHTIAPEPFQAFLQSAGDQEDDEFQPPEFFLAQRTILGATDVKFNGGFEDPDWDNIEAHRGLSVDIVTEFGIGVRGATYEDAYALWDDDSDAYNPLDDFQVLERTNYDYPIFGNPSERNGYTSTFPGWAHLNERAYHDSRARILDQGIVAGIDGMEVALDGLQGALETLRH